MPAGGSAVFGQRGLLSQMRQITRSGFTRHSPVRRASAMSYYAVCLRGMAAGVLVSDICRRVNEYIEYIK